MLAPPQAFSTLDVVVVVLGLPLLIISVAAWRMLEAFESEPDEQH
ncbi:hypothetical protein [Halosegnis rubeus]|jgi:hypothetical protein|nr:hypothetical protein [Halosegnis rubeus]